MAKALKFKVDISQLEQVSRKLIKEVPEITKTQMAIAFMLEWIRRIILRWPVLTGRSRAGWSAAAMVLGISIPVGSDPGAFEEGAAQSEWEDASRGGRVVLRAINAVEYAALLEDGRSDQAPAGAVAISLVELLRGNVPQQALDAISKRWEELGEEAARGAAPRRAAQGVSI